VALNQQKSQLKEGEAVKQICFSPDRSHRVKKGSKKRCEPGIAILIRLTAVFLSNATIYQLFKKRR